MTILSNANDFREQARAVLLKPVFRYVGGGARDEWSLRANETAWSDIALLPRVLRGVSKANLGCRFIHDDVGAPVGIAPTALDALCRR